MNTKIASPMPKIAAGNPRTATDLRKLADAYGSLADAFNRLKGCAYDVGDYATAKEMDREAEKFLALAVDAEWQANQKEPEGARYPVILEPRRPPCATI